MFSRNLMQEFQEAEQESVDQLTEQRAYHAGQWITLMRNTESGELVRFRIGHKRYDAHDMTLEQAVTDFHNFRRQRSISFFASATSHDLSARHQASLESKKVAT